MFHQLLRPVADSLALSFLVAIVPIATVLLCLGVLRRPAWQSSLAGLAIGAFIAIRVWQMPPSMALGAITNGAVFALWPVMWIVFNALLLYNITVQSGRFALFRDWITSHLPNDRRIVLIVIGFCFGALLEGIAGFGAPVAITASLLTQLGLPAMEAVVFVLIFDTTPVAFGALGGAVMVLSAVTALPAPALAAMIGRQLPFMAAILPAYVMLIYAGWRSVRALWPVLATSGVSFGVIQWIVSNYWDYTLTDVFAALGSLFATLLFLQFWTPPHDPKYALQTAPNDSRSSHIATSTWRGWAPWIIVTVTVIVWTVLKMGAVGQRSVEWPGLHKTIAITLYDGKPYAAVWAFQPLGTGTAILVAALITVVFVRLPLPAFGRCLLLTLTQIWKAVVTVMFIVGLAYLMNYSGMAYTLGLAAASTGAAFIVFSPFLGWIAVFLSGSDASGNALFGNLQVVAARQLHLDPLLFAATNSSGGVMGKMISPQNIATGLAVTNLKGREGAVLARTFGHSIVLTLILVLIVVIQQYWLPDSIPSYPLPH
jgi:lactate permease